MRQREPLYVISVAARLLDLHPQTLRKYERVGFVIPSRTEGNLRLYSEEDIARLEQIKRLKDELGVNLAGVEMALEVRKQVRALQRELRASKRADYEAIANSLEGILEVMGAKQRPSGGSRELL